MAEQSTTQQTDLTWLDEESKQIQTPLQFEQRPALRFEENKITVIEVDFSKPFEKWNTIGSKGQSITKAIIPVLSDGEKKTFWLNKVNPLYREIIEAGKKGTTLFKVLQSGNQANTKYILVK